MKIAPISWLDKPDPRPLKVLMWYLGSFPVPVISTHSFSLPKMLWPNATFYIRCNTSSKKTIEYVEKVMKGSWIQFVSDTTPPWRMSFEKYDIIYNYDYWFRWIGLKKYRDSRFYSEINYLIYRVDKPIYLLYCDKEVFHKIENTPVFCKERGDNYPWLKHCDEHKDFSNIHILFNQDICKNWAIDCIDWKSFGDRKIFEMFNIIYLNMKLYYQLPDEYTPKEYSSEKRGCFFGTFFDKRAKVFNTILNTPSEERLNLTIGGRTISKVEGCKYYTPESIGVFKHEDIFKILKPYDWGLFLGRVTPSDYLGMTFYLPFVAGMPVFCLRSCFEGVGNPFEGIDCFFSTEHELIELVKRTNLKELFIAQTEKLKTYYNHE